MAKDYKVVGQAAPSADTDTVLYTVPANTSFVASSLVIANRDSGSSAAYRVAVVPNGESLGLKHYLRYNVLIDARGHADIVIGIALSAGDAVYVHAVGTPHLSFSLFGVENS